MWRTEEFAGVQYLFGSLYVAKILPREPPEASDVIIRMVAYAVAAPAYLFQEMRITAGIVTHHKKRGLDVQAIQDIKDIGSGLGDRTIVKGQIYRPLTRVHPPQGVGI